MQSANPRLESILGLYHSKGMSLARFREYVARDPELKNLNKIFKPNWHAVEKDFNWLEATNNAHIITIYDRLYPKVLKIIDNSPPILYVRGDLECLASEKLAIVGSRKATSYGRMCANHFAKEVAKYGLVVTSGLALGIDSAAHIGALEANKKTIAVLAHGLDFVYPYTNKELANRVVNNGCLISEFPIGTLPKSCYFPRRNRIISGLALGVFVVEAAIQSGSLITAAYALEQGREVFAMPGAIYNPQARGCHHLIRQGAKLVETLQDVIEELGGLMNDALRDKKLITGKLGKKM